VRIWKASMALAAALAVAAPAVAPAASVATTRPGIVPAAPDTVDVDVIDDVFLPASVKVARGGTVVFIHLESTHTVTDGTGMDLYHSGLVNKDDPPTLVTFEAAGLYPYVCVLHAGMVGRVTVPVRAVPATGSAKVRRTITWASVWADAGYIHDVQIKRPGAGWTTWRAGVRYKGAGFTPNVEGRYRFRARMREPGQGRARWSAPSTIRVG
jgi:plastocyanin